MRADGRKANQLRPISFQRQTIEFAEGSCLVKFGRTEVLCTATVEEQLPRWRNPQDGGWVTGEYDMLPRANRDRTNRTAGKNGRAQEISRLIGRSMRAVTDLSALPVMIILDCDVLQADGGTRTAAVTGGFVALVDALRWCVKQGLVKQLPLLDSIAAASVGMVSDNLLLDLDYGEDSRAAVDANVVMTGRGRLVEIQATGEEATFTTDELQQMISLAQKGIQNLTRLQLRTLGHFSLRKE